MEGDNKVTCPLTIQGCGVTTAVKDIHTHTSHTHTPHTHTPDTHTHTHTQNTHTHTHTNTHTHTYTHTYTHTHIHTHNTPLYQRCTRTWYHSHVQVLSDLVLQLTIYRVLCKPCGQVLPEVLGYGGILKWGRE